VTEALKLKPLGAPFPNAEPTAKNDVPPVGTMKICEGVHVPATKVAGTVPDPPTGEPAVSTNSAPVVAVTPVIENMTIAEPLAAKDAFRTLEDPE